jgi:hypothetical protein
MEGTFEQLHKCNNCRRLGIYKATWELTCNSIPLKDLDKCIGYNPLNKRSYLKYRSCERLEEVS